MNVEAAKELYEKVSNEKALVDKIAIDNCLTIIYGLIKESIENYTYRNVVLTKDQIPDKYCNKILDRLRADGYKISTANTSYSKYTISGW